MNYLNSSSVESSNYSYTEMKAQRLERELITARQEIIELKKQLTIADISKAKRTFCDGCMMPDGQNLGNMYICTKCGRSVD